MKLKKIVCVLLSGIIICGILSGCNGNSAENKGEVSVWSKSSTVNVMQDVEYEDSFKESPHYVVDGGRGEYVSAQLVISVSGERTVSKYDISASDLNDGKGNVIGKEYVDLYNEKYIEVISSPATVSTGLGKYADALLPFDKAVEYGENKIDKNHNQGIYIETFIPRDAVPGTYNGNFTLTIDSVEYDIPASITVYDFDVSQESHLETDWITNIRGFGELDTSDEMSRIYFEKIADFRASTHSMSMGASNADEWLDTVRKYTNPNLRDENGQPYLSEKQTYLAQINIPQQYNYQTGISNSTFDAYVARLIAASITDGYDYLKKTGTYMGFIDEPNYSGEWDKLKAVCAAFENRKLFWADVIEKGNLQLINEKSGYSEGNEKRVTEEKFSELSAEFKERLSESMRAVGNYVAMTPSDDNYSKMDNDVTKQFCANTGSRISEYNKYKMDKWAEQSSGNWWYAAGEAVFGNRIDSEPLEQRLAGWYTYDTGTKGYLIWETSQYMTVTWNAMKGASSYEPCDAYELALRITNAAGDGFIFYPGKPYGISGPVSSIRAHQYREASEEYEYFYLLEKLYSDNGYSPKNVLAKMFDTLYFGRYVTQNDALYQAQRKEIINLILLAQKGIFITDCTEMNAVVTLTAQSTKGEEIIDANGQSSNSQKIVYTSDLYKNAENIVVKSGDVKFTLYVDGRCEKIETGEFSVNGGTCSSKMLNGENVTEFSFENDGTSEFEPYFSFDCNKNIIPQNTKRVAFEFYNPTNKTLRIECWFMGKDGRTLSIKDMVIEGNESKLLSVYRLDVVKWSSLRTFSGVKMKVYSLDGGDYSVYLTDVNVVR